MEGDVKFPECCTYCPHFRPVKATCTHDLRQAFLRDVDTDRTCPIFSEAKTNAMRALSMSL